VSCGHQQGGTSDMLAREGDAHTPPAREGRGRLLLHLGIEAEAEEDRAGARGCRPARGCKGVQGGARGCKAAQGGARGCKAAVTGCRGGGVREGAYGRRPGVDILESLGDLQQSRLPLLLVLHVVRVLAATDGRHLGLVLLLLAQQLRLLGEQRAPLDVGGEHHIEHARRAARHLLLDVQDLQVGRHAVEARRGEELEEGRLADAVAPHLAPVKMRVRPRGG
jgi:hypothetical protein